MPKVTETNRSPPRAECRHIHGTCVAQHALRQHTVQARGAQPQATGAKVQVCTTNGFFCYRSRCRRRYFDSGGQVCPCSHYTARRSQQSRDELARPRASPTTLGQLGGAAKARISFNRRLGATLQHHDQSTAAHPPNCSPHDG